VTGYLPTPMGTRTVWTPLHLRRGSRVGGMGEALKVKQKRNIIKTKSKQVGIPPKLIIMKLLC
jgi:hypothetical protein